MKTIYLKLLLIFLMAIATSGCSDNEYGTEEDYPGHLGEPPKKMKVIHLQRFIVDEKNYINAIGRIHVFMSDNSLYPKYEKCFTDVLDIKITADKAKYEDNFPCVVTHASKGDGPPELYFSTTVSDIKFNQPDKNNRITIVVGIYASQGEALSGYRESNKLANAFSIYVAPELNRLHSLYKNQ